MNDESDRAQSFLTVWLSAFEAARRSGQRAMDKFAERVRREVEPAVLADSAEPGINVAEVRANITSDRDRIAGSTLLRAMYRQRRLLISALMSADRGMTGVVALSTKRLPLAPGCSARGHLRLLAKALPGASDPDRIARDLEACASVLFFEPHRVSSLWLRRSDCWRDNAFIIDYAFLAFMCAISPLQTARGMWSRRRYLADAVRRRRGRNAAPVLAGLMFNVAYCNLLAGVPRLRAFLFTSNSFSIELLRAFLIQSRECVEICEMLHGVPTLELENYFATLFRAAPLDNTHRFVSQLPRLPVYGAYTEARRVEPDYSINAAVNRRVFAIGASASQVQNWLEQDCGYLPGKPLRPRSLIVSITGAAALEPNYLTSRPFELERALIRHIHQTLTSTGEPFVICYTPHPLYAPSGFATLSFFEQLGVVVEPDTLRSWLFADVCVGLYSSALFEAAFLGVQTFTPMRLDDFIYPAVLLDRLQHPGPNEGCLDSLTRFLRSNGRTENEDLRRRAKRRAAKLTHIGSALRNIESRVDSTAEVSLSAAENRS